MNEFKEKYNKIIDKAKKRTEDVKGQWHHIKPRCLGGTDEPKNLVKLTYEEHYLCHYLLTKIYPNNSKIHMAYYFMSNVSGKIIDKKQYAISTEKALAYIAKTSSKHSAERWSNPEKKYKLGKKLVTYKEYMSYYRLQQDMSFMKDKKLQFNCNKNKCLKFMWRYLSREGIKHPTDDVIRKGWITRRGVQTNTWKKFYKSFKSWKNALLDYLKENPVDPTYRADSHEAKMKRGKTRVLNIFKQMWKDGRIIDGDYIKARYYYAGNRTYGSIKWRNYYSKKEWLEAIHDIIDNQ